MGLLEFVAYSVVRRECDERTGRTLTQDLAASERPGMAPIMVSRKYEENLIIITKALTPATYLQLSLNWVIVEGSRMVRHR